jgi:TrmH family RNA methyltransferase
VRAPVLIRSRDNPLLQRLRRLAGDPTAQRKLGEVWLEGDHLCRALLDAGHGARQAVIAESAWRDDPALAALARAASQVAVVPDTLFDGLSGLESPRRIGMLIETPRPPGVDALAPSVVLDRVQDPGNVGSILRTAAALGIRQVLALTGSAALWSPKVLRAGMGAHFSLRLVEGLDLAGLSALQLPWIATSLQGESLLDQADLPWPCAWVVGHEGQGVAPALLARCALAVRIPQPGGQESLNVAAAAAICLFESWRRRR